MQYDANNKETDQKDLASYTQAGTVLENIKYLAMEYTCQQYLL